MLGTIPCLHLGVDCSSSVFNSLGQANPLPNPNLPLTALNTMNTEIRNTPLPLLRLLVALPQKRDLFLQLLIPRRGSFPKSAGKGSRGSAGLGNLWGTPSICPRKESKGCQYMNIAWRCVSVLVFRAVAGSGISRMRACVAIVFCLKGTGHFACDPAAQNGRLGPSSFPHSFSPNLDAVPFGQIRERVVGLYVHWRLPTEHEGPNVFVLPSWLST